MVNHFPYSVPTRRDLSSEEKELLLFILSDIAPERLAEIETLKVIARCGCEKCPTVMFGTLEETGPDLKAPSIEMANYIGFAENQVLVGVALLERRGRVSELEAWSPAGDDIVSWPKPSALERVDDEDESSSVS